MTVLALLAGLTLLYLGGEMLLRGAVSMARRLGVSTFLIGITVVGFGTSVPELMTCIKAALSGAPGIAIGNVVGSNIANILLILGVTAFLSPIICDSGSLRRDGTATTIAALICVGIVMTGSLNRLAGGILIALMLIYIIYSCRCDQGNTTLHTEEAESMTLLPGGVIMTVAAIIVGITGTVIGAHFLVSAAIEIASTLGVSQSIIGLSVVALGTSLPELATAIIAGMRGQGALAFGNILGSNIYNVLAILGMTALIHPLNVPPDIAAIDIWIMLGATGLMILMILLKRPIGRSKAVFLLGLYGLYIGDLAYRGL